jgi:phage terminase large subunit-like protein
VTVADWRLIDPMTPDHFHGWSGELVLDTGDPWTIEDFQMAFVVDLLRGFRECWLVMPEGNAKTTLVAALALYVCRYVRWSAIDVAGAAREQAQTDWDAAEGFVLRSPELEGVYTLNPGLRKIRCVESGSRIFIAAADARTGDGTRPTLCITDELHQHRDLKLYRTWRGKLRKRGGQIIAISTAGEPGSEFETVREKMRQSGRDVTRTETFVRSASAEVVGGSVLHEWAVPEDGDVGDLELVKRANPLRAITVDALRELRESNSMTETHWRRFNCGQAARSEAAAITEGEWFGAAVRDAIPEGEPVWAGLDVAWKWDTTALVPVWIRDAEYRLLGPADVLVPPRDGTSLEPSLVEDVLRRLHARNPVHTVVMDETRAEQLAVWIADELGARVVPWPHSPKMAALDYERFMEALREGWLHHTGDPKLTRHVLNAVAKVRAEGTRFDRPSQTREGGNQDMRVIDALVAAAMVHNAAAAEIGVDREPMIAFV